MTGGHPLWSPIPSTLYFSIAYGRKVSPAWFYSGISRSLDLHPLDIRRKERESWKVDVAAAGSLGIIRRPEAP